MKIRIGNSNDFEELQQLFVGTVNTICKNDYNNKQIATWVSSVENKEKWQEILVKQYVLVAEKNNEITGFCTLKDSNYIDFLYVHKDYQRQGIAFKLYSLIETEAIKSGQSELFSEVSITAKFFFEKRGFLVLSEQIVTIKGVEITNYKMNKKL